MADWLDGYYDVQLAVEALVPGLNFKRPVVTHTQLPRFANSGDAVLVENEMVVYVCSCGKWVPISRGVYARG